MSILEVDTISVSLGGRPILDHVSFSVAPGDFTGLIGPNGAGKTTLLRVILGLQRPSAGRVTLDGRPPGGRRGNRAVGYVPQKVALDPDLPMRAWDLVALGLDGNRFGVPWPSASRAESVGKMLCAVDAEHLGEARVGTLSGGEQQKVLIAHALISRPRLLILDEPLANLDLGASQEIVSVLSRVSAEQDVAVLLSAHEMNPLLPVMDRVVYLANGHAASGTTEEVIRPDVLSQLYGHHVDVVHVHGRVLVVAAPGSPEHAPLTVTPATAEVVAP